ncbi:MAG: sugar phosphate isomerase/epimerase [Chitinophagaceae bacterium]
MSISSKKVNSSRREFLVSGAVASLGLLLTGKSKWATASQWLQEKPNSKFFGVQVGVITYSYRSMPSSIDQLLKYIVDSGISAIELMGDAVEDFAGKPASNVAEWRASVSMDKFEEVKKMFNKAGVSIYAFKPNALNPKNTDAEIEYALKAAKALGARSVTVELPKEADHSKRLGDLAAKHKVYIGYHAHTQATDTAWDVALSQSPYNSMNLDCGHYIAAGGNNTKDTLLALIQSKHDRITSMHIKDRKTKDNGGANMPWGQGDTPIKEILNLLKEKKYDIPATIELEYDVPAGSDAVKETRNCLDYAKKALGA